MIRWTLLVACAIGLLGGGSQSLADKTDSNLQEPVQELLDYSNMILSFLNNRERCVLPSYSEVDEVVRRFKALDEMLGKDMDKFLSEDQKLLRNTLLDQWESFQKYLVTENVLKSAKRRSFLCRVEDYQKQKFGESICIKEPETSVLDDPVYEKNPFVRYLKHVEGKGSSSLEKTSEDQEEEASSGPLDAGNTQEVNGADDNDVELKFKVHKRDQFGNTESSKQYVTKLNFGASRPRGRITLHLDKRR